MTQRKVRPGPPAGTRRVIRIDVQYEGTAYVGWQRQAKGASVQGCLEKALSKIASEKITLFASSRTDAGVHARAQVASFSLLRSRPPERAFVAGANSMLPEDIRILEARDCDLTFHAPEAREKTYRYFIHRGRTPDVFLRRFSWHLFRDLNVSLMEEAAAFLVGTHDFKAFEASGGDTRTTARTVRRAAWHEGELGLLVFEVSADGFLKHMVRNIVGTLAEVGAGKRFPSEIPAILESKDRTKAGRAAPSHGLFLWNVEY